jgi:hypothetical protein
LYVDISSIKGTSFGGSKFWVLIIDDFSIYCSSYFLKEKDELNDKEVELIKELKNENIQVTLNLIDSLKDPETFEDAYHHPNIEERMKWREAISKDFDEMKEKGVSEKILKSCLTEAHVSKTSGYSKLSSIEFFMHT